MFSQLGATSETLSKASTMVFRIGTDAHLYDDPEDVNIAPLLDSKFDSEKCEALKRLLALIAQGFDVSNFFPQVVKNVASQSLDVKKLVYLYLLQYAEKRPNEALLSINYFQKDLGDPNPLVRAWALRTMAGIRLHMIAPLVLVAVGKGARDPSVYVRKCAANALLKLHDLRLEEHTSAVEELVGILLKDNSPGVVGAAASAFASICPNNFSLIRKSYRRLCEILPDVEEWGQILLIGILLRYAIARHGLVQESIMFSLHRTEPSPPEKVTVDAKFSLYEEVSDSKSTEMISRCYIEGPDEYLSRSSCKEKVLLEFSSAQFTSAKENDEVRILLQCTSPLLWSNNSAVVLAAAGVHWVMTAKEDIKKIVKPLLFTLRSSNASKYVVLCNIQVFAKAMPSLFAPHFEDFFICSSDSYEIKALKLAILSSIATESSIPAVFKEFQDYIRDPDRRFAADSVAAIGLCAERLPKVATTCIEGLLALTKQETFTCDFGSADREAGILIQAIMSIKTIIEQDPQSHEKVIIWLVRTLDSIKVPAARAMIIWMVGEYSSLGHTIPRMLPTVLKYLAWSFKSEALETKLQIINTTAKVSSCAKGEDLSTFRTIFSYVVKLAECDLNYDVRDRARFLKKLPFCNIVSQELEEDINCLPRNNDTPFVLTEYLFGRKVKPVLAEPSNYRFYLPGSLSQIVLHAAPGYEPLPKPCSLVDDDLSQFSDANTDHGSNGIDDPETLSGSFEGSSDYDSECSTANSSDSNNADPLIEVLNVTDINHNMVSSTASADTEELMSKKALEEWLDDQPHSSNTSKSELSQVRESSARISIGDFGNRVKAKTYTLLDPTKGDGLKVDYSFSSEISSISQLLVCVEVLFENRSSEPISGVSLRHEEPNKESGSVDHTEPEKESLLASQNDVPTLVPMEEITLLEPGQKTKRTLQVHFHHHLLPLKLAIYRGDKKLPVKLRPDIGYFVKPLPLSIEVFVDKEARLPGMFEYIRSCTFTDHMQDKGKTSTEDKFLVICDSIALKMLSNANLSLVSVDMPVSSSLNDASGLRLRFSCEVLSNSIPCLITITVEGKCSDPLNVSVKINSEETVFGLNLLNRIVSFLVESSSNDS